MTVCCVEKSALLAKYFAEKAAAHGCAFFDAEEVAEFNKVDYTHLTCASHRKLAEKMAEIVPALL